MDRLGAFITPACSLPNRRAVQQKRKLKKLLKPRHNRQQWTTNRFHHLLRMAISRRTKISPAETLGVRIIVERGAKEMMYCGYHEKTPAVVQCNQCARWLC